MSELELLPAALIFFSGLVVGVLLMLVSNKLTGGSITASKVKKEKDEYQAQVEAHFEETSKKFKQMASQYQDLYQHMSVGATALCRPENIATGLTDQTDSLASQPLVKKQEPNKSKAVKQEAGAKTSKQVETQQSKNDEGSKNSKTKLKD